MKKAISLLLVICTLFCAFSFFAQSVSAIENHEQSIGSVSVCSYDPKTKTVNISGTINHDVMLSHSKYYIQLYAIPYGVDTDAYLASSDRVTLAKADISVKFEFSVKISNNSERFSSYCVIICNDNGEYKMVSEPKFPSVACNFEYALGNKSSYKGVATELTSVAVEAGASSTLIPVSLNKLLSNTSVGYLYSYQGTYIYFDKTYIDELDRKIYSYLSTGCAVYLQYMLNSDEASSVTSLGRSGIPNMSTQRNADLVAAFTDFICSRYDNRYTETLSGIILGSKIDLGYATSGAADIYSYSENYFRYAYIVASSAREVISSIDIIVPFSDADCYSKLPSSTEVSSAQLTEAICALFDMHLTSRFVFSTMIESEALPYNISDDAISKNDFSTTAYNGISADKSLIYSSYVNSLKLSYKSYPHSYIFNWSVPMELSYGELSSAYAYSYYKMMSDPRLSSFIVSFYNSEAEGNYNSVEAISDIIQKIDTSESFSVTLPQLTYLGADSWYEIIDPMYSGNYALQNRMYFRVLSDLPSNIIGSYAYHDFAYQTDLSSWFGGSYCDSIKIDYNDVSGRTLEAHFNNELRSPAEYAEIFCSYEYHENFVYTPYMAIRFSIKNDSENKDSLYEVKINFGSDDTESSVRIFCSPYEEKRVLLDFSDFNQATFAEHIRISVRCLSGNEQGYSLCLGSIDGYSTQYLSDELSSLILEERMRIRNILEENTDSAQKTVNTVMIVIGSVIIFGVIALGIFMCFKRDEELNE